MAIAQTHMKDAAHESALPPGRPVRMCLVCRRRFNKYELTRFVLDENKIPVEDSRRAMPGRGYYRCADPACLVRWRKRFQQRERGF